MVFHVQLFVDFWNKKLTDVRVRFSAVLWGGRARETAAPYTLPYPFSLYFKNTVSDTIKIYSTLRNLVQISVKLFVDFLTDACYPCPN
jgi:hypothetical protein